MKILRILPVSTYYLSALLLVVAGAIKLFNPSVGDILQYLVDQEYLTLETIFTIARIQPWAEIFIGLVALSGWRIEWTAKGIAALYLFFAGIILFVSEGLLLLPLDCGCFGEGDGTPAYLLLLRNFALSIPLLFIGIKNRKFTIFYSLKE